jgi:hypothetical protein
MAMDGATGMRTTEAKSRGNDGWARTIVSCAVAAAMGATPVGMVGCSGTTKHGDEPAPAEAGEGSGEGSGAAVPADPAIELGPIGKGSFREHPAGVAWVFDGEGEPKQMNIGEAEARGYSIVDLGNSWVPYIFSDKTAGIDDTAENQYAKTYVGLANDRIDHWGDELDAHDHNYLELYGIPPTLKVVWNEWQSLSTDIEPCLAKAGYDPSVFEYGDVIAYKKSGAKGRSKSAGYYKSKLAKAAKKAKIDLSTPEGREAAATHAKTKVLYKRWREFQDPIDVIDHAQRRFRCERMFTSAEGTGTFTPGAFDSATTHALAAFERKHDIMGWGHFKADNLAMLAKTPEEAVHERLLRVITERVVLSTGILEDGSAKKWKSSFRWKDADGNEHELRDMVSEYRSAVVDALDLGTPESAKASLAKISELSGGEFENMLVAVKLPALPAYYSDDMKLETVIDRGDVWYDFPYDEAGNKLGQPRKRYPHLTLYVSYEGQKIPLVHWRTTIGSWRNETKDGELMLKYKNSDVGARVWKDIMAAPVWIPPASTPAEELIKGAYRKGKFRTGVNYDEIGPGYKSAYGLVAAYHVKLVESSDGEVKEFDNGIRTHGSVDYMSILRRFSHGCHRLYNMDAVRLFSFVLRHRPYTRAGQQNVGVGRVIEVEEKTYHMKIGTRGYKYELVEPIPVTVLEGRIKGRRRSPILDYVPRPVKEEDLEIIDESEAATSETVVAPPVVP